VIRALNLLCILWLLTVVRKIVTMSRPDRSHHRYEIEDAWGAELWDIEPTCQFIGIADEGHYPPYPLLSVAADKPVTLGKYAGRGESWSSPAHHP
jgi:hypothetical protein